MNIGLRVYYMYIEYATQNSFSTLNRSEMLRNIRAQQLHLVVVIIVVVNAFSHYR